MDGQKFEFKELDCHQVRKLIMAIYCTKKTGGSISNKTLLKSSINYFDIIITDCINRFFTGAKYPDKLKLPKITPLSKKNSVLNWRLSIIISILLAVSKLFEKAGIK